MLALEILIHGFDAKAPSNVGKFAKIGPNWEEYPLNFIKLSASIPDPEF